MIGSHVPYEERYTAAARVCGPTLRELGVELPRSLRIDLSNTAPYDSLR